MKTEREIKLEEALGYIRDWNFISIDPPEIEGGSSKNLGGILR